MKFWSKYKIFHSRKCIWKYRLRIGGHFVQGEVSEMLMTDINIHTLQNVNHFDELVQEIRNSIASALELRLSCTNSSVGLVQERRDYIANALELRLSCINPSIYFHKKHWPCVYKELDLFHDIWFHKSWVSIISGNGSSLHNPHQAITLTNADLLSTEP